ncbi:MAG: hypothetical protein L0Z53_06190 [Acidobacteriales bacterium]|nr:hypothetical protein [Terriglobales bacterium]
MPGTQSAGTNKRFFLVPFACRLKAIFGKLGTAGTTGNQVNDINKNGTSIFSGATKLNFATGATAATYGALSADPTDFAKGDVISVDVDSIHTIAAVNLGLVLVLQRSLGPSAVATTLTDTVGPDV